MSADYFSLEDEEGSFEDLVEQQFVDEDLTSADVLGRIEEFVAEYINNLARGALPPLEMVSRAKSNSFYARGAEQQNGVAVAVGSNTQSRSVFANQGSGAKAYLRVFKVLTAMHQLLRAGCTATQRDLYYKLSHPTLFQAPKDVDTAIQDVVALLRVPRSALGVTCTSRGAVAGLLHVRDSPAAPWQDCTTVGTAGKAIPGSLSAITTMSLRCTARYLLVIEKDAIFQRLVEGQICRDLPCVLVTAKGMPDLATRAFCAKLLAQYPALTVLGLVDYNPHGVLILRTYKFGSHRMGLECHKYALPGLHWLGLRSGWLVDVDAQFMHQLSPRDLSLLPGLKASLTAASSGSRLTSTDDSQPPSTQTMGDGSSQDASQQRDTGGRRAAPAAPSRAGAARPATGATLAWSDEEDEADSGADEGSESQSDGMGSDGSDPVVAQMERWIEEVDVMRATGYKADIEALYSVLGYEGLNDMVVQAVLQRQYI